MSQDLNGAFDQTVLEMIEHSPVGAVPHTPTYQDALRRLYATHQVYPSADYKDGHVTVRSLARLPCFVASNLDDFVAGRVADHALEPNAAIFLRYLKSLPATLQARAQVHRDKVVGRPIHHRKHGGVMPPDIHDPVHSLFLVPGSGPRHGLPGNYLWGSLFEVPHAGAPATWVVQLHDAEDTAATAEAPTLAEAKGKLDEVLASAPFDLAELSALDFALN
jgi:hypothetical protein